MLTNFPCITHIPTVLHPRCSLRFTGTSTFRSRKHTLLSVLRIQHAAFQLPVCLSTSSCPHPAQVQLFCNYASWWTLKPWLSLKCLIAQTHSVRTHFIKIAPVLRLRKDILMCWHHIQYTAKQIVEVMRLFCFLELNFVWDGMIGCHIRSHYEE